jgi:hypothetical protein
VDASNAILAQTAEVFENLVIRFVPGRGIVADAFPLRIAISPIMIEQAKTHPGVISVAGAGGLGTRLTFTCANGEAIYEIVDYAADLTSEYRLLVADRRALKLKVAGQEVELQRFGLLDLAKLADTWPNVVGLYADVLEPPHYLKSMVRVRNPRTSPEVVFNLEGVRATYSIIGSHVMEDGRLLFIGERLRLQTPDGLTLRLPAAAAPTRTAIQIT